jgi:predicted nucleotidyltransferase
VVSEIVPKLQQVLEAQPGLELAVLVGSQAEGCARPESDWDIAIQWGRDLPLLDNLAKTETLRRLLAATLMVEEDRIDLIDLPGAKLTMRALVAEEGLPLKGEDGLAWNHFLGRTWRELEAYEWEKEHAA